MNGDVILRVSDLDTRALGAKIDIFDEELHAIEPYAQVIASEHPHRSDSTSGANRRHRSTECAR